MRVGVVGTGYVGLVSGTCFAELGHEVVCIDNQPAKVEMLQNGQLPIFEPGLEDLVKRNTREGRLSFSTGLDRVIGSSAIFLALPTPPGEDGSADLSYVLGAASDLGSRLDGDAGYTVVVNKSTVPVGTVDRVYEAIQKTAGSGATFDVVSNPEFLREGQAVSDFLSPDRIVVGVRTPEAERVMRRLYRPLVRKTEGDNLIVTDPASAELIKYAANGFLATKIAFINELTAVAEATGADIGAIRKGMGSDTRIGSQFLYPGPGYGGSCFPKDTLALLHIGAEYGVDLQIVGATIDANEQQKKRLAEVVIDYFDEDLKGKTLALLGLAFKDNTDDIRESPALATLDALLKAGATVRVFDPEAMKNVQAQYGDNPQIIYAKDEYDVLDGADAMVVATNWKEFFSIDMDRAKRLLTAPVVFDGRNIYDPEEMRSDGFYYFSFGRKTVMQDV